MSKSTHTAGSSTRQMAEDRRRSLIRWGIVGLVAAVILVIILMNPDQFGLGGVGFLVLLVLLRMIPDVLNGYARKKKKEIRRAERGAAAEEKIGEMLDNLNEDYEVLHDLDSNYGNIDHLVISRYGGIFMLETKSHRGTITTTESEILLNGHSTEKDFVAQSLRNSFWVREQVEAVIGKQPWVTAVVVFTQAFVKAGQPVKGVRVTNKKYLLDILQKPAAPNPINALIWEKRERIIQRLLGEESGEPESITSIPAPEPLMVCPKCGSRMVQRKGVKGPFAGKMFMVCTKFTECQTAIEIKADTD